MEIVTCGTVQECDIGPSIHTPAPSLVYTLDDADLDYLKAGYTQNDQIYTYGEIIAETG